MPLEPGAAEPEIGTPDDWDRLERELGFTDHDPVHRNQLSRELRLIWQLYLGSNDPSPDIRVSAVRMALRNVKQDTARLFLDLEPSGELTRPAGGRYEDILHPRTVFRIEDPPTISPDDRAALLYVSHYIAPKRRELLTLLAELMTKIDRVTASLPPDRGGPRRDWRLYGTIHALGELYRTYTGKKPGVSRHGITEKPSGPFFRFVRAFLAVFAPDRADALTDDALAKAIQRVR